MTAIISSSKLIILWLTSLFLTVKSRTIHFHLWSSSDLATINNDCFPGSNLNNDFILLNQKTKYYRLTLADSEIPATLKEILVKCPQLQKMHLIDGVRAYPLVTKLDRIMLPLSLFLTFACAAGMIYYKRFSKYKNIVDVGDDDDSDGRSENDFENGSQNQKLDDKHDIERSNSSRSEANQLDTIQRNDSVIPGKVKSLGIFSDNSVAPDHKGLVNKDELKINVAKTVEVPSGPGTESNEVNLYK